MTANVLNVRKQPGVYTSNPPIDKLRYNTRVTIFAEDLYAGATWYRIGADRWVHSGYVRLVPALAATTMLADSDSVGRLSPTLPIGWVVAPSLNVRSSPGAETDATIIGEIYHNEAVNILEAQSVRGQTWYRIGVDRWVYGKWIGVADAQTAPVAHCRGRQVGGCLSQRADGDCL